MIRILGLATCFNRKEKTINALKSLMQKNENVNFSFLIVDDHSTDGTKEALEEMPEVYVVSGDGNLYYSGGMRVAINEAKKLKEEYDYCLLFNDDVEFFEAAIEKLCEKEKSVIWVGPTCERDGRLSYGGVIKTSKWLAKTKLIMADSKEGTLCDTFNANCVLIPWEVFLELDNIDNKYTHSIGDFDYGFEARKKGYAIKVSDEYVGVCPDNPVNNSWRNVNFTRKKRIQLKESPKGLPFNEYFHYLNKQYNLLTAVVYSLLPYIRILLKK